MTTIETIIVVILAFLLLLIGCLLIFFLKSNRNKTKTNDQTQRGVLQNILLQNQSMQTELRAMQQRYQELNESINKTNTDSTRNITSLSEKIEVMDKFQKDLNKFNSEIKTNLDNLNNSTKNIPSISTEIKGISDIYKHAKNRGNFGEFQLKVILDDIFGRDNDLVQEQYRLKNGGIVDFAVTIGNYLVPIDSKFPLDNYRKIIESQNDLEIEKTKTLFKRDIISKFKEATKYISSTDKIEHVIIFIPSEGMFGDIVTWYGNDLLIEANKYHIFLCSPTTITTMLKLFLVNEKDRALSKNIEQVKLQISKIFIDFHKVAKN
jgi:DNA recombination protein RmuC